MNKRKLFTAVLALASVCAGTAKTYEPVDYVSTLVGSESKHSLSTGNTYPAVAMPWGMNFWTPQTGKMGDGWTYTYSADKLRGFKQTHQPSPWINDYGQFAVMPEVGSPVFDEEKRASWFSHKAEVATPYYYRAYLADYDVVTEIAPTERAAIMRVTYPEAEQASFVVDAYDDGSYVKVLPEQNMVVGYTTKNNGGVPENFKNYFVMKFDRPFAYTSVVVNGEIKSGELVSQCNHAGAIVGFKTKRGEQLNVRIASSFISEEQAVENLKELGNDDFDAVKARGRKTWNDVLGKIEVKSQDIDHLRTFYSCLYRSVLFPRSFYEKNAQGEIVHYSPYNGEVLPGYMFTDTGFWDTFRCLFPLLNVMYPSMNEKMQAGLVNAYKESGFLPEWASPGHRDCMVGNNSASIVADAYLCGLKNYDAEKLWEAVVHGTKAVHPTVSSTGRLGYEYYNKLGYVPYDVKINENVARTLEYAYDDWCIYQFGKQLGKSKKELEPFRKRAFNYRNVFDPADGFFKGRDREGRFDEDFNPYEWGGPFVEGNGWQWRFSVQQDARGMIGLMGGEEAFRRNLDELFAVRADSVLHGGYGYRIHEINEAVAGNQGQYAQGNEPCFHVIHLYNHAGQPWKAQRLLRESLTRLFNSGPEGFPGDEDGGAMSSWYVFNAMGFYTVTPGVGQYVLGSPLFDRVTIRLENGRKFVITADGNAPDRPYIRSATLNGAPWTKNWFDHETLMAGGELRLEMSGCPNTERGTAPEDRPYSMSDPE